MNARTDGGAGSSPELAAAIAAAVSAFLEREAARLSERREGISAWRRVAHAGFGSARRGWRERD